MKEILNWRVEASINEKWKKIRTWTWTRKWGDNLSFMYCFICRPSCSLFFLVHMEIGWSKWWVKEEPLGDWWIKMGVASILKMRLHNCNLVIYLFIYFCFVIFLFFFLLSPAVANDLDGSPKGGVVYLTHLALGIGWSGRQTALGSWATKQLQRRTKLRRCRW